METAKPHLMVQGLNGDIKLEPDADAQQPTESSVGGQADEVHATDALASALDHSQGPAEAEMQRDAGESPAAKRAKHTDMAESEAAPPVVALPAPAAADPPGAQGGSLSNTSHLPNTLVQLTIHLQ